MKIRKVLAIVVAIAWGVASTPFLLATVPFLHGEHSVTLDLNRGVAALVLHHHGEDSNHHHAHHHSNHKEHSTQGDDHQLEILAAEKAVFQIARTQLNIKFVDQIQPFVFASSPILRYAPIAQHIEVDLGFEGTTPSLPRLRTIVLHI